jgi:hypothetical protein
VLADVGTRLCVGGGDDRELAPEATERGAAGPRASARPPVCAAPLPRATGAGVADKLLQGPMSSVVRALPLLLLVPCLEAHADVGLLPPDARAMGRDEARAARAAVDVAREVVKGRLRPLSAADVPVDVVRCLDDAACRKALLERLEVEELGAVAITPVDAGGKDGAFASARLVVWTVDGVDFDASARLASDRDLRGLLTRAFDPGRATARLDVEGLADGDVVLIDGLRSEPRALLASGDHTVVVLHEDGTRTTLPVTLAFEERRTLTVPPRVAPTGDWPGLWPAVVGGGVAIAGGIGAGIGGAVAASEEKARPRDVALAAAVGSGVVGVLGLATVVIAFATIPFPEASP